MKSRPAGSHRTRDALDGASLDLVNQLAEFDKKVGYCTSLGEQSAVASPIPLLAPAIATTLSSIPVVTIGSSICDLTRAAPG